MEIATFWRRALLIGLLALCILLPRLPGIASAVSPDEPKWLTRSANFYHALARGDWAGTYQVEHPGVPVMYAGMASFLVKFPAFAASAPAPFKWDTGDMERWLAENTAVTPLDLLVGGRWAVVLMATLLLVLTFFPLRRLFGAWGALVAVLFVAWSPFGLALSQRLHPDGLMSMFIILGLSAWLAWLYGGQALRYLLLCGVATGLAGLTKVPAIFLVATGVLLLALDWWRRGHTGQGALRALWWLVIWGAVALGVFVLFWPAMWVDPFGSLRQIVAAMGEHAEGHSNPNFFWGQIVDDPGVLFYPVATLFRMTPATTLGLILAVVLTFVGPRSLLHEQKVRRSLLGFGLFAVIFLAGMAIGAKKSDRYVLPALLALDVVAAIGWVGLAQVVWRAGKLDAPFRRASGLRRVAPVALALLALIALHAIPGFTFAPYYFAYFNPLVGGTATAPAMLVIGWGEGMDAAGRWLNAYDDGRGRPAVAAYSLGSLSYFYDHASYPFSSDDRGHWLEADYAVTYANQWQRLLPDPDTLAFLAAHTPVFTYSFRGLELAQVYDLVQTLPPPASGIDARRIVDFGGALRLLDVVIDPEVGQPDQSGEVALFLKSIAPMATDASLLLRLSSADGAEVWRSEGWPWGAPTSQWPVREVRRDAHPVALPEDLPAGLYKLTLAFYDSTTLDPWVATYPGDAARPAADTVDLALIPVGAQPAVAAEPVAAWDFGDAIRLAEATLPAQAAPGQEFAVDLTWQSREATPQRYTAFVHVVDSAGNLVAQQDRQPQNGFAPTDLWRPGMVVADRYVVTLPADLPAGVYRVLVGLYDGSGARLMTSQDAGSAFDAAEIGTLRVE